MDFGCGVGTWVRACLENGITDVVGVDGDYVQDRSLVMPPDCFVRADLTQPLDLGRSFDVVISLEVAEHLPPGAANTFVSTLTRHAPVVLFSAAVPNQGGTHHTNEQWAEYWIERFGTCKYLCIDCVRPVFWEDSRINWWYRQNAFLFVAQEFVSNNAALSKLADTKYVFPRSVVHPEFLNGLLTRHVKLSVLLQQTRRSIWNSLQYRLRRT